MSTEHGDNELELGPDDILVDGLIKKGIKNQSELEVAIGDGMEFTIHGDLKSKNKKTKTLMNNVKVSNRQKIFRFFFLVSLSLHLQKLHEKKSVTLFIYFFMIFLLRQNKSIFIVLLFFVFIVLLSMEFSIDPPLSKSSKTNDTHTHTNPYITQLHNTHMFAHEMYTHAHLHKTLSSDDWRYDKSSIRH